MKKVTETTFAQMIGRTIDIQSEVNKSMKAGGELELPYVTDIVNSVERFLKSNIAYPKRPLDRLKNNSIILLDPEKSTIPTTIRYIPVIQGGQMYIVINTRGILRIDNISKLVKTGVTDLYSMLIGALGVLDVLTNTRKYLNVQVYDNYCEVYIPIIYNALLKSFTVIPVEKQGIIKTLIAGYIKRVVFDNVHVEIKSVLPNTIPKDVIDYVEHSYYENVNSLADLLEASTLILKNMDNVGTPEFMRQLSEFGTMYPIATEMLAYGIGELLTAPMGYSLSNSKKVKMTIDNIGNLNARKLYTRL